MTAPSVLTFIALADELNRITSALQNIANGNVSDQMESAQKTLEETGNVFNYTHTKTVGTTGVEQPLRVHKLADCYMVHTDSHPYLTGVIYRADHGKVYAVPRDIFERQFVAIAK